MKNDFIKSITEPLNDFWKRKDSNYKRKLITIVSLITVLVFSLTFILSRTRYSTLYADLDLHDAGVILSKLKTMKVNAKPVNGNTILVPSDEVDRLRMTLASEGYPKNGFSLDILQKGMGLGMTEEDKKIYRQMQLQEHIRNAILTFEGIKDAKVIITLSEEGSFVIDSNKRDATAAVLLTLDSNISLNSANVKAIASFVQKSVPDLKMENVNIIDSSMRVLDFNDVSEYQSMTDRYSLQCSVQDRLKNQVMDLLQPVFGIGRVKSQVNVVLDFDEQVIDSIKFEPVINDSEGIAISIDKIRELVQGNSAGSISDITAIDQYPVISADDSVYQKNAEKINYEVNSIKEHVVKEKGAIKKLSVSVVIDSKDTDTDLSENIKALISTAVGVEKDSITVEYMPMEGNEAVTEAWKQENIFRQKYYLIDQIKFYIPLVFIAIIIVILFILLFKKPKVKYAPKSSQNIPNVQPGIQYKEKEEVLSESDIIQFSNEKAVKEQIGKIINKNPELVANILHNWLKDDR